jgi:AcrR family transcriptional regulator
MTGQVLHKSRKAGQIARTKIWIEQALITLVAEDAYTSITVSRLCQKAGVGRQTFYRYFSNKDDVIRSRIRKIFDAYADRLQAHPNAAADLDYINLETLRFWKANQDVFNLVTIGTLRPVIFSELDALLDRLVDMEIIHAEMDPYLTTFRHWGMKGVLLRWAETGMTLAPEEINAILRSVNGAGST